MKDNYKALFESHYGITVPKGYEIHHIDLNHDNNSIENLMVIPKGLHRRYHFLLSKMGCSVSKTANPYEFIYDVRIHSGASSERTLNNYYFNLLSEILLECREWYDYKLFLDGKLPNVHRISLKNGGEE